MDISTIYGLSFQSKCTQFVNAPKAYAKILPQHHSNCRYKMCPLAQPATKIGPIVKRLNEMIKSGDINEFEIRRYKQEAEKLKQPDPAEAFTLLGMIACIEGKVEQMHSHHKNALNLSNEGPWHLSNYAISLIKYDMFEKAYHYAVKAYKKEPSEPIHLSVLIGITNHLDLEDEFQEYALLYRKLTGEDHQSLFFPEDDDQILSDKFEKIEKLLEEKPDLIVEPDPDLLKLADELVEGVDLN